MYKSLDEPIDVIAHFEKGALKPLRFLWQGRTFRIARVTGTWKAPQGDKWVRHFSVVDSAGNVFFLTYDERSMRWAIGKVWVE
jgi:hypothetical protein